MVVSDRLHRVFRGSEVFQGCHQSCKSSLYVFHFSFEATSPAAECYEHDCSCVPLFLSWDSSGACPSTASPTCSRRERSRAPSPTTCHSRRMSRPRGLSPPRRVPPQADPGLIPSRKRSWGSLRFCREAPVSVLGSSKLKPHESKLSRHDTRVDMTSPQCSSHPSKNIPRQQPHRITAAVAFLLLPCIPA